VFGEPGAATGLGGVPVHDAGDAVAAVPGEVLDGREVDAALAGVLGDGAPDGVLGGVLEGAGDGEHLLEGLTLGRVDLADAHVAGGHGAGLVEDDGVDAAGGLQDLWAFDEDAELCAATGADEQRCGGGEPEGAGAGDDQDGDGGGEGRGGGVAGDEPGRQGGQRETDDDGDEHGGHAVGESLDVGLAVLGVLDEAGHLGELGVGADAGGLHDQASARVDRGSRPRCRPGRPRRGRTRR
jgi:hypothetical protein